MTTQRTVQPLIQAAEQYRLLAGMNNAEYSRFIGISESLWYKFKAGKRTPSKGIIVQLSNLNAVCNKIAHQVAPELFWNTAETPQKEQGRFRSAFQVVRGWWQSMRGT